MNYQKDQEFYNDLIQHICSDYVVALELISDDCILNWLKIIGNPNSKIAKNESPESIRAIYGTDFIKNAVHGSISCN